MYSQVSYEVTDSLIVSELTSGKVDSVVSVPNTKCQFLLVALFPL